MKKTYQDILEKTNWSHRNGRSTFEFEKSEVELGRLFSYSFRGHTIGAFSACRSALQDAYSEGREPGPHGKRAIRILRQLEGLSVLPVPEDVRALLHTFHSYDTGVDFVIDALKAETECTGSDELALITTRFEGHMEDIKKGNGIAVTRDDILPVQASFIVPNLGITIIPLVYGDYHSWNSSHLPGNLIGATTHRHHAGVEIHLGYSPMYGRTLLGDCCTVLHEGYAMPIPVLTDHGMDNLADTEHCVPFVFGSMTLGGWGVFFDVDAKQRTVESFDEAPLDSPNMNGSVFIERVIERQLQAPANIREIVIPASATASGECGALELGIYRVDEAGCELRANSFRIISVVRGKAAISIGPSRAHLGEHDHCGIPSHMDARIAADGPDPLVILDVFIGPC